MAVKRVREGIVAAANIALKNGTSRELLRHPVARRAYALGVETCRKARVAHSAYCDENGNPYLSILLKSIYTKEATHAVLYRRSPFFAMLPKADLFVGAQ